MRQVDINWRSEIERFIERRAKQAIREKILSETESLLKSMKKINNYELIREDRDER